MKKLIITVILVSLTGCMSFSDRPMRPIRNSILEQNPSITLEKEVAINIGGGLFKFIDAITLNEADLSEIDSVQIAVYRVHGHTDDMEFNNKTLATSLAKKDPGLYWDRIVRVRDDGEHVWIFAGMDLDRNSLEAISVFVLERNELVLINLDGDIDDMIEYALDSAYDRRRNHDHS